jgi:hypothetical protein
MIEDNTRPQENTTPETRGLTAFAGCGIEDNSRSSQLFSGQTPATFMDRQRKYSSIILSPPVHRKEGERPIIRDVFMQEDCEMTVGTGFIAPNKNAAPKDRMAPGPFCGSKPFEGILKGIVHQVSINLRGRDVPVPQRPLDHEQVGGRCIQVGGECMTQPVRADALIDAGLGQPMFDAAGHLPWRKASSAIREEQRLALPVALTAAFFQVTA